jgi:hypothetical protein
MGVSAVLRPAAVTVDPGRAQRCQVYVRNTGRVVDQFVLHVVGDVAGWATLRPPRVNLLPNEETLVELVFQPPLTYEVLAGDHPFAIRVVSREDTEGSIVSEGIATVTEFVQLNAQIVPHTSRARRTGRHTLAVDNVGNFPLTVSVRPTDPDALLRFRVRPAAPVTEPGTATMIKVRPKPLRHFWRGNPRRIPFTVDVVPDVGRLLTVDAVLNQKPLLPRRFFLLLSLLLVLLLLLILLLTTILQKQPVSMAGPSPLTPSVPTPTPTPTTSPPTTTVAPPTTTLPTVPLAPPLSPQPPLNNGAGTGGSSPAGGGSPPFTITAVAYPGSPDVVQTFSYAVPAGSTLRLASVALTDQQTDSGTLAVRVDTTPVATFDLADVHDVTYRFPSQPTVTGGQLVTLAVTCADTANPCFVTAAFTTAASP